MVLFGPVSFPHVLNIQNEKARVELSRIIPTRNVDYRVDASNLGRTVRVTGEIRDTTISGAAWTLETLRRLRDGVTRSLNFEDGTTPAFNAKMGNLQSSIKVENWFSGKYFIQYSVDLLEV